MNLVDRTLGSVLAAARWLVLPVALILFLQWPMRDFVQWGSREANDLGQWIFALYVSLAVTYASRVTPKGLTVRADSPYKSFNEYIEAARRAPGTINYGSTGVGTSPHLLMEEVAS